MLKAIRRGLWRQLGRVLSLGLLGVSFTSSWADEQSKYYRIVTFPTPDGEVLEACGFESLPGERLAVCTRRGDIWVIADPQAAEPTADQFSLMARGLHEPLSMAFRDGWLYVTQRPEVSRIRDTTGDGRADQFETVADDWGIGGDYHEYAFASKFDRDGELWVVLCLTGSFSSEYPYRGWCVRVGADGRFRPTASGIRSPGGVGANLAGDIFYTDNQGPWNGTCGLKHLKAGSFQGHPGGFGWYDLPAAADLPRPEVPKSGSRIMTEAARIAELEPTAVLFPYVKMGQSASGIACDISDGKFGPFSGQLFVADQTHSTLMRVDLEQVKGHYQGACFPFVSGLASGGVGVEMTPDGSVFVGGTSRGWGARGGKDFSIQRIDWTGREPLAILRMLAQHDGFELLFTRPVDRELAGQAERYKMQTYTYIYQSDYGSPEVDHTEPTIVSATPSDDGLRVRLVVDGLQIGHVHELHIDGLLGEQGESLWQPAAYYTLNFLPEQ